jgi:hypothetical protein
MGFGCQLAAKSRVGQAPANGKGQARDRCSAARANRSLRHRLMEETGLEIVHEHSRAEDFL